VIVAIALLVVGVLLLPLVVVRAEVSRSQDANWLAVGEERSVWEQALSSAILLPAVIAAYRYLIRVRPQMRRRADT
jgi:uncharacterized BrkB/YihY/UPF0761 family membrane protein